MTTARPSSSIESKRRPSGETQIVRTFLAFSKGRVELVDSVKLICMDQRECWNLLSEELKSMYLNLRAWP